ncbi:MAG TPA: protoporphyrinogen oxidase [Terriglobales bacterium]|jgi:oxygen-dependent protoporphyrinogen oxidase|nr:protoporphyrinogen oxidase [Terriglobales bacterium]
MKRIAIIGGGISGLSAAFALEKRRQGGASLEYALFESSPRFGGVLVTEWVDGCLLEAGPDSFLTEKPWASDLSREVGLGDQLIGSNDADRQTYILVKGRLVVMPDGLMFMVPTKIAPTALSPLFSARTKMRMAREWFHPPRKAEADETVASFVERHYGSEMVDRLADPLLSGVYGGEASQLSVRAVLPRFAEMEATHGSLGRAMLAARKKMAHASKGPAKPLFTSLKDGMQQLVDAVVSRLPASTLHSSTPVQRVQSQNGGWVVSAGYASDEFDAVIMATPAQAAAELLGVASVGLASELRGIQYTSSVTVNLGYDRSVRASLPPGFGFLVPRSEGRRMLAATFVHNKFPHRAPEDRALLRCFIGGARNEQVLQTPDDEIVRIVREELGQVIKLKADPLFTRVYRWNGAMAQYGVGHLERLQRIESLLHDLPSLALAGNGYRGIGVPDCIRSGNEAANSVLLSVGLAEARPTGLAS